jgi:alpha-1,3-rhamnosyl/mannosyltransferase
MGAPARLNVVYDLRYATDHFPGIGAHARALLAALLGLPATGRFRVLWRANDPASRFDTGAFASHARVDWTIVGAPALGVRAPFATGDLLRRLGGDVYLSPFYLRPVRAPMPVVLTLHDAMHLAPEVRSPLGVRLRFALALRQARGAAGVLTSSRFSREELVRRAGFPAERLHLVPLGVPPRWPGAPERPAGAPDRAFALVVGGNRPHKGLDTLARAWRRLGGPRTLDLVSAGPVDPRFPSLDALAARERAPGTHTLGVVSPAELEWLYANATLLVLPSVYEGFGLPLIEAAARGTPVIASDIPALREIGENAVRFVPAGDDEAWADAVARLAADATERDRLRSAGLDRAARHDYADVARRVHDVLEAVVGGRVA